MCEIAYFSSRSLFPKNICAEDVNRKIHTRRRSSICARVFDNGSTYSDKRGMEESRFLKVLKSNCPPEIVDGKERAKVKKVPRQTARDTMLSGSDR